MKPIKNKLVLDTLTDNHVARIDVDAFNSSNQTENSTPPNKAEELYNNYVAMSQLWEMDVTHEVKIEGNQSTEFVLNQLSKKLKDPEIERLVIKEKTLTVYLVTGEVISHTGKIQALPYPELEPIFPDERLKCEPPPNVEEKLLKKIQDK